MKNIQAILIIFLTCSVLIVFAQENTFYSYDAVGRLTAAYTTSGTTNSALLYQYDAAGNRIRYTGFAPAQTNDLDGDTLDDMLELHYFKSLDQNPVGDPDNDGLVNSNEFAAAGDPTMADTDGDEQNDRDEFIAGTALDDSAEYFHVTNAVFVADQVRVMCDTKSGRTYQLQSCLQPTDVWTNTGSEYEALISGPYSWDISAATNAGFRIKVWQTVP